MGDNRPGALLHHGAIPAAAERERLELHCLATSPKDKTYNAAGGGGGAGPSAQLLYQCDERVGALLHTTGATAAAAAWHRWRSSFDAAALPAEPGSGSGGRRRQVDYAEAAWRDGQFVERHSSRYQRREPPPLGRAA